VSSVYYGKNTFGILEVKLPNVEKFQNKGLKNFEIKRFPGSHHNMGFANSYIECIYLLVIRWDIYTFL
jgi:hypothetical protein